MMLSTAVNLQESKVENEGKQLRFSEDAMKLLRPKMMGRLDSLTQEWAQKQWVWVLDSKLGCRPAHIIGDHGDKPVVRFSDDDTEIAVSRDDVEAMNPPKYDKIEDMAELSHLNESSVLHNIRERYFSNLIYTYSGLFLVVINPWKKLPLYTADIIDMYKGRRRNELPPHIYAVCDVAYRNMIMNRENQSILVTGESGAGKTENTKKVIQYFAAVSGTAAGGKSTGEIETQLIQANPIMEAFGNAKTRRNNNSSRFGKFIRIEFGPEGSIVGANVETYLLEKSRVVRHDKQERSFHVFYQFLEGSTTDMKKHYFLEDVKSYRFLQGVSVVDGVDDKEEFRELLQAMDVMLFSEKERDFIFRTLSSVLLLGNLKFTCSSRDDAAQIQDTTIADKIAHLLNIQSSDLIRSILRPQVKASKDWVTVAVSVENAYYSVEAVAKVIYERLFRWIVFKINQVLETKRIISNFIGVLDIAGFEIFDTNSFEQLCINFTNEKLQQFFNHHMFILEQEEYRKENIEWNFHDFGLDLEPTISLIEKSLGIFSILDEQCLFPKATDQTFIDKLHETLDRKTTIYKRFQLYPKNFQIAHYAGDVVYATEGWLEKNKDPVNDNLMQILSKSGDLFISRLFEDYLDSGDSDLTGNANGGSGIMRRTKGSRFITVSQRHKQQLTNLMNLLRSTQPHFVRCILPNEYKKPGVIDAQLVLDQLRCNGVVEGIRISREGFPSRIPFSDFRQRYEILQPHAIPQGFFDSKKAAQILVEALGIDRQDYRIGISKIFFKQGCIADLEEERDRRLTQIMIMLQARGRGILARRDFRRTYFREDAIKVIQRNARVYIRLRQWSWWRLYSKVKPLLGVHRQEEQERALKQALAQLEELLKREQAERIRLERLHLDSRRERDDLDKELATIKGAYEDTVQSLNWLEEKRDDLEKLVEEFEMKVEHLETSLRDSVGSTSQLSSDLTELKDRFHKKSNEHLELLESQRQLTFDLGHLRSELDSKGFSIESLEKERDDLKSKLDDVTDQIRRQHLEKSQLADHKKGLESQLEDLNQRISQLTQVELEKRKQDEVLRHLEAQLHQLRQDHDAIQESSRQKEASLAHLQDSLKSLDSKNQELLTSNQHLTRRFEETMVKFEAEETHRLKLEKSKKILEEDLTKTTGQLGALSSSFYSLEDEKRKTDRQLDTLKRELTSELDQTKVVFDKERTQFEMELQRLRQELETQQLNQKKLRKEGESLSITNAELSTRIESLERAKQQSETVRIRLDAQLAELREFEQKSLRDETVYSDLQKSKAFLQAELDRVTYRLVELERTLAQVQQKSDQTTEDLQEQLDETRRKKSNFEREKIDLETELQEMRTQFEISEAERTRLTLSLDRAYEEIRTLKSNFEKDTADLLREVKRQHVLELEELNNAQHMKLSNIGVSEETKQEFRQQISEFSSALDKERVKSADLDRRHKRAEEEVHRLKHHLDTLGHSSKEKDEELMNLRTKIMNLEDMMSRATSELESLKRVKYSLQSQLEATNDRNQENQAELANLAQSQRDLQSKLDESRHQLDFQQQRIGELEDMKSRAHVTLQDVTKRWHAELNEKYEELLGVRRDLEGQITELTLHLQDEKRAHQNSSRQKRDLELRLTDLLAKQEIESKRNVELQEYRRNTEIQFKSLQLELDRERDAKVQATEALHQLEKAKLDIDQRLMLAMTESRDLRQSVRRLEAAQTSMKDALEQSTSARDTLMGSKKLHEQELEHLSRSLRELESRNDELQFEKRQHAQELVNARQTLSSDFEQKLSKLEESKRGLQREITSLLSRIDDQTREISMIQQSKSLLEESLQETRTQLGTEFQTRSDTATEKRKALQELRNLRSQMDMDMITKSTLETIVKRLEAEIMILREKFQEKESDYARVLNSEAELRGEVTRLETSLSDYSRAKTDSEHERRRLEMALDQTEQRLEDANMALKELRTWRHSQEDSLNTLRMKFEKEIVEKDTRLDTLQTHQRQEISDLREKLDKEITRNLQLRDLNASLEKDAVTFRNELENELRSNDDSKHHQQRLEAKFSEVSRLYELSQHAGKLVETKHQDSLKELGLLRESQTLERGDRENLESTIRSLREQCEHQQKDYFEAEKHRLDLEGKLRDALGTSRDWQERFDRESEMTSNLQAKIDQFHGLLAEVQTQVGTETRAKSLLEHANLSLDQEVSNLRLKLNALQTSDVPLARHHATRLEAQVKEATSQLDEEINAQTEVSS